MKSVLNPARADRRHLVEHRLRNRKPGRISHRRISSVSIVGNDHVVTVIPAKQKDTYERFIIRCRSALCERIDRTELLQAGEQRGAADSTGGLLKKLSSGFH